MMLIHKLPQDDHTVMFEIFSPVTWGKGPKWDGYLSFQIPILFPEPKSTKKGVI